MSEPHTGVEFGIAVWLLAASLWLSVKLAAWLIRCILRGTDLPGVCDCPECEKDLTRWRDGGIL